MIKFVALDVCDVCEQHRHSGIHLFQQFICDGCEQRITNTDVGDPVYYHIVEQLRKSGYPATLLERSSSECVQ